MKNKSLSFSLSSREKKTKPDGSLHVVLRSRLYNGDKNFKGLKIKNYQLVKILHSKLFWKILSKIFKKAKMKD